MFCATRAWVLRFRPQWFRDSSGRFHWSCCAIRPSWHDAFGYPSSFRTTTSRHYRDRSLPLQKFFAAHRELHEPAAFRGYLKPTWNADCRVGGWTLSSPPLTGRVEDWRAGRPRYLDRSTSPAPSTSHATCLMARKRAEWTWTMVTMVGACSRTVGCSIAGISTSRAGRPSEAFIPICSGSCVPGMILRSSSPPSSG